MGDGFRRAPLGVERPGSKLCFGLKDEQPHQEDRVTSVLIVGHDRNSAADLAAALGRGDFQFEYADASEAVKKVAMRQPDLVMLDIPLPDSGSISLYRQ